MVTRTPHVSRNVTAKRVAHTARNGAVRGHATVAARPASAARRVWAAVKRHPVRTIGAVALGVGAATYIGRRRAKSAKRAARG